MKPLLDLLPFAIFLATYFLFTQQDFYIATAALMISTATQVALTWLVTRKVSRQLWLTFGLVMVLGGLTVTLHNKMFLFWKPTLLNLAFAIALMVGQAIGKNPLRLMLGTQLTLPDKAWRHLTYGWTVGFIIEAALNLWVAFTFSESFWVLYKFWGGIGLTLLYVIGTGVYLSAAGLLDGIAPHAEEASPPTDNTENTTPLIEAPEQSIRR